MTGEYKKEPGLYVLGSSVWDPIVGGGGLVQNSKYTSFSRKGDWYYRFRLVRNLEAEGKPRDTFGLGESSVVREYNGIVAYARGYKPEAKIDNRTEPESSKDVSRYGRERATMLVYYGHTGWDEKRNAVTLTGPEVKRGVFERHLKGLS